MLTRKHIREKIDKLFEEKLSVFLSDNYSSEMFHQDVEAAIDLNSLKECYPTLNDRHISDAWHLAWVAADDTTESDLIKNEAYWFITLISLITQIPE